MSAIIETGNIENNGDVMASSQASRAMAEVQSAMVIAKRFPRDEMAAINKIMNSCKRITLAEAAMYSYPKGGQRITGPSIRLAESMAQAWGNLDFGIVELEQREGESVVMSYCIDLETNTRQVKVFTVKHERGTKQGVKKLTDPRDIYEMTANQGARRLRACILGIIPGDVQDMAVEQCEKTIKTGSGEPLVDRVRKMVVAFSGVSVSKEMLEQRLGHSIEATDETEFVGLRKIYLSLRDSMSRRQDWFAVESTQSENLSKALAEDAAEKASGPEPEKPAKPERDNVDIEDDAIKSIMAETEIDKIDMHAGNAEQELDDAGVPKEISSDILLRINQAGAARFAELTKE